MPNVIRRTTGTSRNFELTFEIEGDKELAAGFDFIGNELRDMSKPLKDSAKLLLDAWDKNFDAEGSDIGEAWKALSPKYAAWKAKHFPGKGILVRTGKMQRSFNSKVTPVSATLSNPTWYFKFHQSNQPRSRLPRRVMMKIDSHRRDMIIRIFTTWLNDMRPHFKKVAI